MAAAPTQHQQGWGRSFELVDGTGATLADMSVSVGLKKPAVEPSASITLNQLRDGFSESDSLGGNIVLEIGHDGSGGVTSASVSVDASDITLTTNLGSQTLPKAGFAILKDLVDEINLASYGGWSASLSSSLYNQLAPSDLDYVSSVGALSPSGAKPARIKKDAADVADFFSLSSMASLESQVTKGLPDALSETLLAGGARGATSPASIVAALEKFEKFHVNSIVPLFSRDATEDKADGLTDLASTYTLDAVHQAVKTHISLMKTTKKRSERQGYLSLKDSYADCKTKASDLADGRLQLLIQDIRQADASGVVKWFQPWALACLMAGARGGAPIGEPMTFKFLNCSGLRQTGQAMSTPDANIVTDFDPDLQTDDAIQAGITFLENPQTGGFRVVVDNTTYGRDGNFVWNRGNVIYAADIVAFNFRNSLESVFVGKKNTVSVADIAGVASTVLNGFLTQGITVSTPDAPQGFKNLVVRLEGNTIHVEVTIKIVEGIDFIISEITIQRATA
jgi:predicted amino acid-binding ACT domain protein